MITGTKHVSIPVKDQDKALSFYTKKLGFSVVRDVKFGEGQRWIELKIGQSETKIVLFTPEGQENRIGTFSNVIFYTENLDQTYKELIEKEVEFLVPPTKESWGFYSIFKDCEGNSFCLSSAD